MIELAVLFMHHNCTDVVWQNLASFKRWNTPIYPVFDGDGSDSLPDSWRAVDHGGTRWHVATNGGRVPDLAWSNSDLAVYAWIMAHAPLANHYMVAEWDSYASCDPHSYLRPVKGYDCSAPLAVRPHQIMEWFWFKQLPALNGFGPYACGLVPLCGTIVSDRCLRALAGMDVSAKLDCFSELRMGTMAGALGYPPVCNPEGRSVLWQKAPGINYQKRGIYHPVKELLPSVPEACITTLGE